MEKPWADLVLAWVPQQRWFAGKGLRMAGSRVARHITVDPSLSILFVEVDYHDKTESEFYQVPVAVRRRPPGPGDAAYIGTAAGEYVFDGVGDPEGSRAILGAIRAGVSGADVTGTAFDPLDELPPRAVATEQSNSSVVFGDRYIMKVFRRLWPGRNPDLALTLELSGAGNPHAARPLGWLASREWGAELTLALVQEYFADARQGWDLATASLHRLLASVDTQDFVGAHPPAGTADFSADAFDLGVATARVHASLARRLSTEVLTPHQTREIAERVTGSLHGLLPVAPRLRHYEKGVAELVDRFARNCAGLPTQRIHNDLHLTQVLRTASSWILIDFEGEPSVPIRRRNEFGSPLRDVACMLRSFDYVAYYSRRRDGTPHSAELVDTWLTQVRSAFWRGYLSVHGDTSDSYSDALLFFEVEKALFEIDYEYNHRPDWFDVAAESTYRLLSGDLDAAHHGGGRDDRSAPGAG